MKSDALLTEALDLLQSNKYNDDDTDDEDGDSEDNSEDEYEREKRKKKEKKRKKKEKKEKKRRRREKEREDEDEDEDEDDEEENREESEAGEIGEEEERRRSEHHRQKKKRKDKDRDRDRHGGREHEDDNIWRPGDDKRDFEVKRIIRRYPTPPEGFGEDGRGRAKDRDKAARDREECDERKDEGRSHRKKRDDGDERRDDREEGRFHKDERDDRKTNRDDRGDEQEHRRSHRDERDTHKSHRDDREEHDTHKSHRDERDTHRSHRDEREERDTRRDDRDDHRSHKDSKRSHRDERDRSGERGDRHKSRRDSGDRRRSSPRGSKKRERSRGRDSEKSRPPVRKEEGDVFWDTKWEAMELNKKIDKLERKGQHYLDGEDDVKLAFRTPTPERERKKREANRSPSPECDELRRLRELKEIQDLTVKESDKYVKEPLDPKLFEWNNKTKMWCRKAVADESSKFKTIQSYDDEIRQRMDEQFKEQREKDGKKASSSSKKSRSRSRSPAEERKRNVPQAPKESKLKTENIPNSQLTMDEIESIKRKKKAKELLKKEEDDREERRKDRKEKVKEKSEEGEIESEDGELKSEEDEEVNEKKKKKRKKRSRSKESRRSRSRSRDRKRAKQPPPGVTGGGNNANMEPIGEGGSSSRRGRERSGSRSPMRSRGGFGFAAASRSRSRSQGRGGFGWSQNSRSPPRRGRSRSRDRFRSTRRSRSRSWGRGRSPPRRRGRGKRYMSRSRSRDDGGFRGSRKAVDKEKLLAIARKNAVKLLSSDNLMGMDQERLLAMKAGGGSLGQLVDFCKELSKKGIEEFSDEEIMNAKSDDEDNVRHPFQVTDKAIPNPYGASQFPGGSLAKSGIALEYKNPAMKAAAKSHRMIEFPVSSGNAHRTKESDEQIAIKADEKLAIKSEEKLAIKTEEKLAIKTEKQLAIEGPKAEEEPKEKEGPTVEEMARRATEMAVEEAMAKRAAVDAAKEAALLANQQNPLGVVMFGGVKIPEEVQQQLIEAGIVEAPTPSADAPTGVPAPEGVPVAVSAPVAVPAPARETTLAETIASLSAPAVPSTSTALVPVRVKLDDKVFESKAAPTEDIGSIVSQRLTAMRKLEENPTDSEALQQMYHAQKSLALWTESKNKPGQFTGNTGAKILSRHELNLGNQAWARQDQFSSAKKVSGGFGEYLLRKMGWTEGDGLGKNRTGEVDPLTLDIKFDKRGLMAAEEGMAKKNKRGDVLTLTGCKDFSGKHPVSALIELSTKRRWGQPSFVQAFEVGPPHRKQYIFKVVVDGRDFQPSVACDNKKKAKADAATFCLQEMGLVPKDPNNPL